MPRIGEMLGARYQVTQIVGRGMFSRVVRAVDTKDSAGAGDDRKQQRSVIVKIVRNIDMMARVAAKEVALLKQLAAADPEDRRRCIRLLAHFEFRSHVCMVFEPMEMDLRRMLRKVTRGRGVTLAATQSFGKQLMVALLHLHRLGYVHADVKPDNMVVGGAKQALVKLCDFGSAIPVAAMGEYDGTSCLVSRLYRAPEVVLGLPRDARIDVWSAACVMFELFAGDFLFSGADNNALLASQFAVVGEPPGRLIKRAKFRAKHFDDARRFVDTTTGKPVHADGSGSAPARVASGAAALQQRLMTAATVGGKLKLNEGERRQVLLFKDFLLKCLTVDPQQRLTSEAALRHAFMKQSFK